MCLENICSLHSHYNPYPHARQVHYLEYFKKYFTR